MKGYFLTLLLFLVSICLNAQQGQWYLSNGVAMKLEAVDSRPQSGWSLWEEQQGNTKHHRLYLDSVEKARWEWISQDDGSQQELYYRDGNLQSRILNDGQSRLLEEQYYQQGSLHQRREYNYPQAHITLRSIYNGENQLLFQERMRYRQDGSLLSLLRLDQETHINWSQGEDFSQQLIWLQRQEGEGRISLFNEKGQPIRIALTDDGELLREDTFTYDGLGRLTQSRWENPIAQEWGLKEYDSQERLISEELHRGNVLVSSTSFLYTGSLLKEKRRVGRGPSERWIYFYSGDTLISEEYYLGQDLVETRDFSGDE